jgi:Nucleotidyl transferase AbiEii toxin, Type IV TA system
MSVVLGPFSLQRMVRAVEKVRERLLRAAKALQQAGLLYAVAGGNAVAAWVTRVDEAAVRNTQDVDVLIRRSDLEAVKKALEGVGFVYRHSASLDMFLDGPHAKARDSVHILFAGEKVRPDSPTANPDVTDSVPAEAYQIMSLEALVSMKLTAFRDKDRVHLRDLIDVGLIEEAWCKRFPAQLAERLQQLLDTPNG